MHLNINVDCRMQTQPPSPLRWWRAGNPGKIKYFPETFLDTQTKLTGEKLLEILQRSVVSELIKTTVKTPVRFLFDNIHCK
jgi:hypothetical protein